jgi:hypothetical protein
VCSSDLFYSLSSKWLKQQEKEEAVVALAVAEESDVAEVLEEETVATRNGSQ